MLTAMLTKTNLFALKPNKLLLSLAVVSSFYSTFYSTLLIAGDEIPTISIEGTELSDVSGEQVKSADVAEALSKKVPSISIIRRSGIANDVILRGQNRDNINVTFDNAKIYGACPNRMDPPISHILANNIESIDIIEGPYDVENFGTLSGAVKIKTKKPEQDIHGEISVNVGSWNYKKFAANFSGGNDKVRALVSVSKESSDQYEDGDGNNFDKQIKNNTSTAMVHLKDEYSDMQAYDKQTFMGKIYFNPIANHEFALSYTANRSDDVLYPTSKMDALYDDSNILNLDYTIKKIAAFSKKLEIQYYDSDVEHPMSTHYRNSSGPNSANEKISKLTTRIQGAKIINAFDINSNMQGNIGLDTSLRNWDGEYIGKGKASWITGRTSINDVDTKNRALFAEFENQFSNFTLKTGARYDDTSIDPAGNQQSNDYTALNGFAHGTFKLDEATSFFAGLGKSSRVPDARELYFAQAGLVPTKPGPVSGTANLDQVSNYEIDFGVEHNFENLTIKTKLFHSWLKDYIYYNADRMTNNFENIDATIYGFDISGMYFFSDELYLDFGLAYQRGKKDKAMAGQTDKDLANITPAKLNLGLNYDYMNMGTARIEIVAVDSWDNYDADNGEQELDSYAVLNLKVTHNLNKSFQLTAGLDNVFNKTYAVNNTYKDLILLTDGAGEVMLINEPGRYYYINGAYKF